MAIEVPPSLNREGQHYHWEEGSRAAFAGKPASANPYNADDGRARLWLSGYNYAQRFIASLPISPDGT